MRRLGCVLCPLARNSRPAYQLKARLEIERWPGIARLWFRACEEIWRAIGDHEGRNDFASPAELWHWWLRSEPIGGRDDGACGLFGPPVEIAEDEGEAE